MANRTAGTNANNSLVGFQVGVDEYDAGSPSRYQNLQIGLKNDLPMVNAALVGNVRQLLNGAYMAGRLWIPNRGELVLKYGDFVCFDSTTGWPIVLSADAAANGPWTHS